MTEPLVSIGVPSYNRPKTLERALKSLTGQTYKNLEIIVSDNCSSNSEVETVMRRFITDTRVKYFRQPVNKGAYFNFNFLLDKFTGDYFMRLGDDDWLDENYVESCLSFLQANKDYVCAYGQTKLFNLNNEFVKYDPSMTMDQDLYVDRIIYYFQTVTQNGAYFGLIKSELISCMVMKNRLAEDWLGIARLNFAGKIKMLTYTSLNISQGGIGGSMTSIVRTFGLPGFNNYFPFFSIAINAYADILVHGPLYKRLNFLKRISLANAVAKTLYRRFNVKNEIKENYREYLKTFLKFGNKNKLV